MKRKNVQVYQYSQSELHSPTIQCYFSSVVFYYDIIERFNNVSDVGGAQMNRTGHVYQTLILAVRETRTLILSRKYR